MGLSYSEYSDEINCECSPLFPKFLELPTDVINVIISHTTNRLVDLCLINKYFSLNCKQARIDMLYKDYVYYELTDDDINVMISLHDGERIFSSHKSDLYEKITHILKPSNLEIFQMKYVSHTIFHIQTNGYLTQLIRPRGCGVRYASSTKEEINMFLRKTKGVINVNNILIL